MPVTNEEHTRNSAASREWSLAEAAPAVVAAGLAGQEELDRVLRDMQRAAEDETVLAIMPRISQVWARRRPLSAAAAQHGRPRVDALGDAA